MTKEELEKIDWSTHCLMTTYHQSKNDEIYIKVFGVVETTPTGFVGVHQLCFDCQCYEGQGYKTDRDYLRCELVGKLYDIVEIPDKYKMKQMSIFDFLD